MTGLKNIDFGKLGRIEKNLIEESIYAMMSKFKNTPLELDNTMPKDLYTIVENNWHYCLNLEKQIRGSTLPQVMPELTKEKITKANKKYDGRFAPKYREFSILQNNIEDVVKKSIQMWKVIYGLSTVKQEEEDPFEGRNDGDENDDKEDEKEEKNIEEEAQKIDEDMATTEEQQEDQSVPDTQISSVSPSHDTNVSVEKIIVKDVLDATDQNINALTAEHLKKILHQSTLQAQLCSNLVLVNVEELQKVITKVTRDKVNTQEPPSSIPYVTSCDQCLTQTIYTSIKVDTSVKEDIVEQRQIVTQEEKETTEE